MVLGFIAYWPIGLAILGFLMFTGRMRAWREARELAPGQWYRAEMPSCGSRRERRRARRGQFAYAPSSGNAAFDEYRSETLRRLEEEQREFVEYLERLRKAKDRQEFEQFMAERNRRPAGNGNPPVDNV
jgi:hypothetical protein